MPPPASKPKNVRVTQGGTLPPIGQRVLSGSDLSYLGAMRMPSSGVNTVYAKPGITGRQVNGKTHLFVHQVNTANPEQGGPVVELVDTGTYHPNYLSAPRMAVYAQWGDIYQGKDISWNGDGSPASFGMKKRNALYWHEGLQRLYWTFYDNYNVTTARQDWGLGFTARDGNSGTIVSYGPFRQKVTDSTGTYYGGRRSMWLWASPDGEMLTGASLMSGVSTAAWGPNQFGSPSWPSPQTPAGWQGGTGASDLTFPHKDLMYYFTPVGPNGMPNTGIIKSMRRMDAKQYIYDVDTAHGNAHEDMVDPLKFGGHGSWTSLDFFMGGLWLNLPHVHGVIYAAQLIGNTGTNPNDCSTSAHCWYSNSGAGTLNCPHGCTPGTPGSGTGPTTNAGGSYPAMLIYDPDSLIAVRRGATDYSIQANETIDPRDRGAQFSMEVGWAPSNGISGFYFDPSRNYLFVQATGADTGKQHLIHVFKVADS